MVVRVQEMVLKAQETAVKVQERMANVVSKNIRQKVHLHLYL
jgi:hypothetical protein